MDKDNWKVSPQGRFIVPKKEPKKKEHVVDRPKVYRLLLEEVKKYEDEQIEELLKENAELRVTAEKVKSALGLPIPNRWDRYSDMMDLHANRELIIRSREKYMIDELDKIASEG